MLVHRLRRWPNIEPILDWCIVFAGMPTLHHTHKHETLIKNLALILGQRPWSFHNSKPLNIKILLSCDIKNVNPLSIKREYSLIRLYGEDKS